MKILLIPFVAVIRMSKLAKREEDYLIWIESDDFYQDDKWILTKHKYYKELSKSQKERIYSQGVIDFTLCWDKVIRDEIKNACAYLIEYKIINIANFFHDKYIIDNFIYFINKYPRRTESLTSLESDKVAKDFEEYLLDRGIITRVIVKRISGNMEMVEYNERSNIVNFVFKIININNAAKQRYLKEKDKDTWDIRRLDIKVDGFNAARPRYIINFNKIKQEKIREVVKKYEYERLKTKKYACIIDDLKAINIFSKFLYDNYPHIISLDMLTRDIVLKFLEYVEQLDMKHTTKAQRKGCIRVFLNLIVLYGWENTPKIKLISKDDYTKRVVTIPKPIDSEIIKKLNNNLKYLPKEIGRMVIVIENVGMRVNELCTLKVGSVKKDLEGDYFLEYYQSKTNKSSRIPITNEIAEVLLQQETEVLNINKNAKFIFSKNGERPISQESFSYHINKLAFEREIRDSNGKLYRFRSHHFRHTVATNYVNNGMEPNMIRLMLGHANMKSIMSYIDLRDSTVINEMSEILDEQNKLIQNLNEDKSISDLESIELVNGACYKPFTGDECKCITKCYSCSMFKFDEEDRKELLDYLERIKENIAYTEKNGFERMAEVNKNIKADLERILSNKD